MDINMIIRIIVGFGAFILAGSVHEFSHGYAAGKLGDDTAEVNGRLTLAPLAHIDPIGTIVLPLLLIVTKAPFVFGWMRPVPVNPFNFKNEVRDQAITAAAGPLSNLLMAIVALIALKLTSPLLLKFALSSGEGAAGANLAKTLSIFLVQFYYINVTLMAFNLIPVPPLDGGWIVRIFLPEGARQSFERIYPYGGIILLLLIMFNITDIYLGVIYRGAQFLLTAF